MGEDELAALCGVGKDGGKGLEFRDPLQADAAVRSGGGPLMTLTHAGGRTSGGAAAEGLPVHHDRSHGGHSVEDQLGGEGIVVSGTLPTAAGGLGGGGEASGVQSVAEAVWQRAPQQQQESAGYPAWKGAQPGLPPEPTQGQAAGGGRPRQRATPYKVVVAWGGDETQGTAAAAVMDPELLQEYESLVQRMQQAAEHPA